MGMPRTNQLLQNQKPELIVPLTSLMYFGMIDFGRIALSSLMTAQVKGHYENEENRK